MLDNPIVIVASSYAQAQALLKDLEHPRTRCTVILHREDFHLLKGLHKPLVFWLGFPISADQDGLYTELVARRAIITRPDEAY